MITRPKFCWKVNLVVTVVCAAMVIPNSDARAADQLTSGTNARQIREQALQSIPMQQLTPQIRAKITPILEKPSIYRRLPITAIDVDPDYFLFLVRYPEVVVNIWQLMGVTKMTADRTGPFTLKTNDGSGAISDVELVYGTNNLHVYLAEGVYTGPLLKRRLQGQCVMILRTNYQRGPGGAPQTVNSLDVFLKVENATASLIAKTLNPIVGATADHNFVESLNFVQRLNETTVKNGIGVQRMANRLTRLTPGIREKFASVAGLVFDRSRAEQGRDSGSQSATFTDDAGFGANTRGSFQRQSGATPATMRGYSSYPNPSGMPRYQPLHRAGDPAGFHSGPPGQASGTHDQRRHLPANSTSPYPVQPAFYRGGQVPGTPQVQYSGGFLPR